MTILEKIARARRYLADRLASPGCTEGEVAEAPRGHQDGTDPPEPPRLLQDSR